MKSAVPTGLKPANAPIEWATLADGILYTAQIPMKPDGSFETGDIWVQTELTLQNLKQTVEAADDRPFEAAQGPLGACGRHFGVQPCVVRGALAPAARPPAFHVP